MPTYNRRRFIPQALRCFANRTYRNAELIVVDDSERSVRSLCERVEGVRYLRVNVSTTGTKLNIGIEAARGEILQRMDDDDYYGPRFLRASVHHLLGRDPERTLVTRCCFLTLVRSEALLRKSGHPGWAPGGTFCFYRAAWRRVPFRDISSSEDSQFRRDLKPEVVRICDPEQYVVVRHGHNHWTSLRMNDSKPIDTDDHFRNQPPFEKSPAELLDSDSLTFYRRVLRWRRP